jgi:hypothetical protein
VISLVVALLAGGWALYHRDQIESPGDFLRLAGEHLGQIIPSRRADWETRHGVLRVCSFNAEGLDQTRLANPLVAGVLAKIIAGFDVVALQQIDASDPWLIKRFLSSQGPGFAQYECICGVPAGGPDSRLLCNAIIYNRAAIELDGGRHYTVRDPDQLISGKPQVAWFRARTTGDEPAFTFTLVNLWVDPAGRGDEILQVGPVFRAVRGDGRGEDDVILAGDFGAAASHLAQPEIGSGLAPLVRYESTTTAGDAQRDNILIDSLATGEFTGQSGVYDFLKAGNLTLAEARLVSGHLPVWAEFLRAENAGAGRIAQPANERAVR